MGALSRLIRNILARTRDLTSAQRVALLLGGALVAISLVWLVFWAATPEMTPLLDQALSGDELTRIEGALNTAGVSYETRGNRIFVPTSANRTSILAQLQQQDSLPSNTSIGFAALIKESNPWISQEENNRRWTYALQEKLQAVLSQFQGVHSASVFLNLGTQRRSFSKLPPPSSAGVTLTMQNGDRVPRPLALAAARLVAGAVAGLNVRDVQVLDAGGGTALDWETEGDPGNALERMRQQKQTYYSELIRRQIPDNTALISVQVEVDTTARNSEKETPIKGVVASDETTSERTVRRAPSGQPGVQPNVAVAAGGGVADESTESETARTENRTGLEVTRLTTPAGDVKLVTAAISLSSSYLAGVFVRTNPEGGTPTDSDLEAVFTREQRRLLPQVARLVIPQAPDNVALTWHYDTPAAAPPDAQQAGGLGAPLKLVSRYGPQSAVALLALTALGMMLRLARRPHQVESLGLELGLPPEAVQAAQKAAADMGTYTPRRAGRGSGRGGAGAAAGGSAEEVELAEGLAAEVEQAATTEGMLVAHEVDAGTVQTRKMLDQVADMVKDDPEVVASLVEQWIERHEAYRDNE